MRECRWTIRAPVGRYIAAAVRQNPICCSGLRAQVKLHNCVIIAAAFAAASAVVIVVVVCSGVEGVFVDDWHTKQHPHKSSSQTDANLQLFL